MSGKASMAEVAALVGDPARANILGALMDGRALTATELAYLAHVTPQTASGHLAKLVDGKLLAVAKQGRHRYFCIASPLVARMLEGIDAVAAIESPARHSPASPRDAALRHARFCYDHLAGKLGVALADALIARGHVILGDDGGTVTHGGSDFLGGFGLGLGALAKSRRAFCRPCLDWSERRPHLAGALGAALAVRCLDLGWIARQRDTRAVSVTAKGRGGLRATFGIDFAAPSRNGQGSAAHRSGRMTSK